MRERGPIPVAVFVFVALIRFSHDLRRALPIFTAMRLALLQKPRLSFQRLSHGLDNMKIHPSHQVAGSAPLPRHTHPHTLCPHCPHHHHRFTSPVSRALSPPLKPQLSLSLPLPLPLPGSTCRVTCAPGFLLPSASQVAIATCFIAPDLALREWRSETPLQCDRKRRAPRAPHPALLLRPSHHPRPLPSPGLSCGAIDSKPQVRTAGACDGRFNTTCALTCANGHTFEGTATTTCLETGEWSPYGQCVDTDACLPEPCAAKRSVCRDLPAAEHVGTGKLPYACDCAPGRLLEEEERE